MLVLGAAHLRDQGVGATAAASRRTADARYATELGASPLRLQLVVPYRDRVGGDIWTDASP